ncbi:MAG: plasmid pRiA4b ORF-3 family protein [Opitutaceae bacterium]|jgi:hypothetical protein
MISLLDGQGPAPKKSAERALQLRLQVVGCQPPVWRRLRIKESMWLSRLHDSIQLLFDWYDYQTHAFTFGDLRYGNPLKRDHFIINDDRDMKVSDLNLESQARFTYGYHFGEGWQVEVMVEMVLPVEKRQPYPFCMAGERAGPPEDCGGLDAFHDMLACIQEPETELGREWLDWLGPDYDPKRCDLDVINKALKKLSKH